MNNHPGMVFERVFSNDLNDMQRAIDEACHFLGSHELSPRARYVLDLTIEEVATNVLKYAYTDSAKHEILMRLEIEPECVQFLMEDDGKEFDPVAATEPSLERPIEERAIGGLGIHLVRKLAERVRYERRDGKNRLFVWIKKLYPDDKGTH